MSKYTIWSKGSSLFPLTTCSYQIIDKGFLFAFAERWHTKTNTFHLLVEKMTVTLDDVASLLDIPITGAFYNYEHMDKEEAIIVLVELLGVEYKDAFDETKKIRGEQFSLSWLQGAYEEMCEEERWDEAAKAYLFHLVGCTLFANKNATYVEVKFLDFL